MSEITNFPDDSFLRIYHAPRILDEGERVHVETALSRFMDDWRSHESPVRGAFEILHDRFVVIAADESAVKLSGCSKDAMTGVMRDLGAQLGLDFVHAPPMCFRRGEVIHSVTRGEFADLVERGEVSADTPVFDLTIAAVGPYKSGRFELPARESWHGKVYDLLEG